MRKTKVSLQKQRNYHGEFMCLEVGGWPCLTNMNFGPIITKKNQVKFDFVFLKKMLGVTRRTYLPTPNYAGNLHFFANQVMV